jgi:GNAT superfamily N-acetyltransferase
MRLQSSEGSVVQVKALQSSTDFERYAHFGHEVYAQNRYWVPTDAHHLISLLGDPASLGSHLQVQAFWAEEGGRIQATVTAVVDAMYNQHWNERTGHLLFFEALPDCAGGVQALFQTASEWLQARGCRAARASFLYAWQLPLSIDAYEVVPTIFHTYNPPYYHSYFKNAGFRTEHGMVQYQITFTPELARRYQEMVGGVGRAGVHLRCWDFGRLEEDTVIFTKLCNETFAQHWGSPQFTLAQMRGLTSGLQDLLVPDFTAFAEVEGDSVGFVFSLPDLNQALHRMGGKSPEENLPAFQRYLAEIDHGVLLIIGVAPNYRGRGINLALAARSYLAMIARGYKTGSYTVVLDDNWASRRTAEKLGGEVARNFIIYRKELAP